MRLSFKAGLIRTNSNDRLIKNVYTCGNIDPIKVEHKARTAPLVTRYLKQDKQMN